MSCIHECGHCTYETCFGHVFLIHAECERFSCLVVSSVVLVLFLCPGRPLPAHHQQKFVREATWLARAQLLKNHPLSRAAIDAHAALASVSEKALRAQDLTTVDWDQLKRTYHRDLHPDDDVETADAHVFGLLSYQATLPQTPGTALWSDISGPAPVRVQLDDLPFINQVKCTYVSGAMPMK